MEEATTQHLIIAQMLGITEHSEEIINQYELTLPALTLDTIEKWEQKLRSFLKTTPLVQDMQKLLSSYVTFARELGFNNFYASTSLR